MSTATSRVEPVLRTLAPALRRLEQRLRGWMDSPRRHELSTLQQARLEGLATDLSRSAIALDVDRPLLVIAFMGGTGVGKSTLLNALARGEVAAASYTRPTTRDPVVYYHESVRPDRLDKALQQCRLVAHDRPGLEQKILVDTPDLDSNDLSNREKLRHILPLADVVLYVGSQEKYHDRLGWELFLEQRKRRAFAFVLNKWDRCLHGAGETGLRPDADMLRDLESEGFTHPMLYRTCAQAWVDANGRPPEVPEGEQFAELEQWLEAGLTRLEIEAIKSRGVSQMLRELDEALEAAKPPEVAAAAQQTHKAWDRALADEAQAIADILLVTIDPYQRDIEQHFAMEGHRRFHGFMAGFLGFATRVRYFGTTWRKHLPRPLRGDLAEAAAATAWDLAAFSRACSGIAAERHLDARGRALPNRLLVLAEEAGFPVGLLAEPTEAAARSDWRQRFAAVLIEVLHEAESQWAKPTGARRIVQHTLVWLGDLLPALAVIVSSAFLLYDYFWSETHRIFSWTDLFLPLAAVFFTLLILYVVIILLLAISWPAIRGAFHRRLTQRIEEELAAVYRPIPEEVAERLEVERKLIDQLIADSREVAEWLKEREQAANISGLYGN
jgi:hypothetical protein